MNIKIPSFLNGFGRYKKLALPFSLICLVIVLDQFFKSLFEKKPFSTSDFLGLSLGGPFKNSYFLFGLKMTDDLFFISIALTSLFLLFCFYYFLFLFFADDKKFYRLKAASSLVFGGWISNFIDKFQQFYVLDYIKWDLPHITLYFNLADLFQTAGWILFIQQVISLRADIFRPDERRKRWFVLNKLQYQFMAYFTLIFVLMTSFFILLVRQALLVFGLWDDFVIREIAPLFFIGLLLGLVFLYFFVGLFFVYFSNKIYGSIYAFERYVRELIDGKTDSKDFRLRKGDQLRNLEALARDIKKHIKTKNSKEN